MPACEPAFSINGTMPSNVFDKSWKDELTEPVILSKKAITI